MYHPDVLLIHIPMVMWTDMFKNKSCSSIVLMGGKKINGDQKYGNLIIIENIKVAPWNF